MTSWAVVQCALGLLCSCALRTLCLLDSTQLVSAPCARQPGAPGARQHGAPGARPKPTPPFLFLMFAGCSECVLNKLELKMSIFPQRYCRGTFTKSYKKTIGVDFLEKQLRVQSEEVTFLKISRNSKFIYLTQFRESQIVHLAQFRGNQNPYLVQILESQILYLAKF